MPIGRAWRHVLAREVVILMTGATSHSGDAFPRRTSMYIHPVLVGIISLPRKISTGMAVHAAWVMENRDHGFKGSGGRSIITGSRAVHALGLPMFIAGRESPNHKIGNQAARDRSGQHQ